MRLRLSLTPLLVCLILSIPALAQTPHETWIHPGAPTTDMIRSWSKTPGSRSLLLQISDPASFEIEALEALQGVDRLMISMERLPNESTLASWKSLARRQNLILIGFGSGLPQDSEITRLNQIGPRSTLFVLPYYPDPAEAAHLTGLRAPTAITFATTALPRFLDRDGLQAIPFSVPLLFVSEYWPWYSHMDVLNMTPHDKRLRIRDSLPSPEALEYLHHIRNLKEVALETTHDLDDMGLWSSFKNVPVQWISVGRVPSNTALTTFETNATHRTLTLDLDQLPTTEEMARLKKSPLRVEWIHLAPGLSRGMRKASLISIPWLPLHE